MPSLPVPSSFSLIPIKVLSHPLLKFVLVSITADWLPHGQVRCWVAGLGNISLLGFWAGTLWCFSSLTSYPFSVSFDDLPNLCTWECSKAWSLTLFSAFFRSLGDLIQSHGSKRHLCANVRLLFLLSPRFQTCGHYCVQESCTWISNRHLTLYTWILSSPSSLLPLESSLLFQLLFVSSLSHTGYLPTVYQICTAVGPSVAPVLVWATTTSLFSSSLLSGLPALFITPLHREGIGPLSSNHFSLHSLGSSHTDLLEAAFPHQPGFCLLPGGFLPEISTWFPGLLWPPMYHPIPAPLCSLTVFFSS